MHQIKIFKSIEIKQVSYRSQVKQEPFGLLKSLRIRLGMTIEDEILALRRKVHDLTESYSDRAQAG